MFPLPRLFNLCRYLALLWLSVASHALWAEETRMLCVSPGDLSHLARLAAPAASAQTNAARSRTPEDAPVTQLQTPLNPAPKAQYSDEMRWISSLFVSQRNVQYQASETGVSGDLWSVGLSLTGTWQDFYLDLSAEANPTRPEESTENLIDNMVELQREDLSLTLGYAVNPYIRVFGGYKYGRTKISALENSVFAGNSISLTGRGLFMGAGGAWPVRDLGVLSFSAAYADLRAIYHQAPLLEPDRGQANGTSLSVGWRGFLSRNLYYDLGLIRHHYEYGSFNVFSSDISEKILSIRAGLSYNF